MKHLQHHFLQAHALAHPPYGGSVTSAVKHCNSVSSYVLEFRRTGFRAEPLNLPCECEAPA